MKPLAIEDVLYFCLSNQKQLTAISQERIRSLTTHNSGYQYVKKNYRSMLCSKIATNILNLNQKSQPIISIFLNIQKLISRNRDEIIAKTQTLALDILKQTPNNTLCEDSKLDMKALINDTYNVINILLSPVDQTEEELLNVISQNFYNSIYFSFISCKFLMQNYNIEFKISKYSKFVLDSLNESILKVFLKLINNNISSYLREKCILSKHSNFTSFNFTDILSTKIINKHNYELFNKTFHKVAQAIILQNAPSFMLKSDLTNIDLLSINALLKEIKNQNNLFQSLCVFILNKSFPLTEKLSLTEKVSLYEFKSFNGYIACLDDNFSIADNIAYCIGPSSCMFIVKEHLEFFMSKSSLNLSTAETILKYLLVAMKEKGSPRISQKEMQALLISFILAYQIKSSIIVKSNLYADEEFKLQNLSISKTELYAMLFDKATEATFAYLIKMLFLTKQDPILTKIIKYFILTKISSVDDKITLFLNILTSNPLLKRLLLSLNYNYNKYVQDSILNPSYKLITYHAQFFANLNVLNNTLFNALKIFISSSHYSVTLCSLYSDGGLEIAKRLPKMSLDEALELEVLIIDEYLINTIITSFACFIETHFYKHLDSATSYNSKELDSILALILKSKHFTRFIKTFTNCLSKQCELTINVFDITLNSYDCYVDQNLILLLKTHKHLIVEYGLLFIKFLFSHYDLSELYDKIKLPTETNTKIINTCIAISLSDLLVLKIVNNIDITDFIQILESSFHSNPSINELKDNLLQILKQEQSSLNNIKNLHNILGCVLSTITIISEVIGSLLNFNDYNLRDRNFIYLLLSTLNIESLIACFHFSQHLEFNNQALALFINFYNKFYQKKHPSKQLNPAIQKDLITVCLNIGKCDTTLLVNICKNFQKTLIEHNPTAKIQDNSSSEDEKEPQTTEQLETITSEPTQTEDSLSPSSRQENPLLQKDDPLNPIDPQEEKSLTIAEKISLECFSSISIFFQENLSEKDKNEIKSKLLDSHLTALKNGVEISKTNTEATKPASICSNMYSLRFNTSVEEDFEGSGAFSVQNHKSQDTLIKWQSSKQSKKILRTIKTDALPTDTSNESKKNTTEIFTTKEFIKWLTKQSPEVQLRINTNLNLISAFRVFTNSKPLQGFEVQMYELKIKTPTLRIYYTELKKTIYILAGGNKQNQDHQLQKIRKEILPALITLVNTKEI